MRSTTRRLALLITLLAPLSLRAQLTQLAELAPGAAGNAYGSQAAHGRAYLVEHSAASWLVSTDGTPAGTRRLAFSASRPSEVPLGVGGELFLFHAGGLVASLWGYDGLQAQLLTYCDLGCSAPVAWQGVPWYVDQGVGELRSFPGAGLVASRFPLPPAHRSADVLFADAERLYLIDRPFEGGGELLAFDGSGLQELGAELGTGSRIAASGVLAEATLFEIRRSDGGFELWRTDGSASGTYRLRELEARDPAWIWPQRGPVALGGRAWFLDLDGDEWGLFATDGTLEGTLIETALGAQTTPPDALSVAAGALYFAAEAPGLGREPWTGDGHGAAHPLADLAPGEAGSDPAEFVAVGPRVYFVADDGFAGRELWTSDGGDRGTGRVRDLRPGAVGSSPQGLIALGERLIFVADDGESGREPWVLATGAEAAPCVASEQSLCLAEGFRLEADWRDFATGRGRATAIALTPVTGGFWFFSPDNVELLAKVLDGSGVNGHRWLFEGALSNVGYRLTAIELRSGRVRRYDNPPGTYASLGDVDAFPSESVAVGTSESGLTTARTPPRTDSVGALCTPAATRLCLGGSRFAVEVTWSDFTGGSGAGIAVPFSDLSGSFSFFAEDNQELFVKVFDGRALNQRFWFYSGALTNVGYRIQVRDLATGAERIYVNPVGRHASFGDTEAF